MSILVVLLNTWDMAVALLYNQEETNTVPYLLNQKGMAYSNYLDRQWISYTDITTYCKL